MANNNPVKPVKDSHSMNICLFNLCPPPCPVGDKATRTPSDIESLAGGFGCALEHLHHRVMFYDSKAFQLAHGQSAEDHFKQFLKENKIDVAVWFWSKEYKLPPSLKDLPCKLVTVWYFPPKLDERFFYPNKTLEESKYLRHGVERMIALGKPCEFLTDKFEEIYAPGCIFRDVLEISDGFVLLSDKFFSKFAFGEEKLPGKICTIPRTTSYETQNVSFDEKKNELLWCGYMDMDVQQPQLLLGVWQKLQDRFPDWSLHLVGRGIDLPELKNRAKKFGLKNVSIDETGYDYRSASIFCMTSKHESSPDAMIDAMSCSCVPVAFDSFIMARDVIEDGENGYLVQPFDIDAYTERLAQLMQDSALRERLGSAARESVVRFSLEAIIDKWKKLFREIGC